MRAAFLKIIAALLIAGPAAAETTTIKPVEPAFVTIGNRQAAVYYVVRPTGYQVVVTFAANSPDDGTSMRSVAMLMPGMHHTVSIAGAAGEPPYALDIVRSGDAVIVTSGREIVRQASLP